VLILEVQDDHSVLEFAVSLALRIEDRSMVDGTRLNVGASVGIAVYPDDGTTAQDLVKRADASMYIAKRTRRRVFRHGTEEVAAAGPSS
jgi:diguanylate cyclase (GGDEF)-like protein